MESTRLNIKVRPMTREDLDGVLKIEESAYGDHHWSKESFANELSNNLAVYKCAFVGDKMVGYSGFWQLFEEAHITTIAIAPEFRGKKIGESMLKVMIDDCYQKMVKYLTLEVRVSNEAAKGLYEKYGFKSLGVRKGYYQNNNEDALIMWTENIFWDKFKSIYEKNMSLLESRVEIECQNP